MDKTKQNRITQAKCKYINRGIKGANMFQNRSAKAFLLTPWPYSSLK